LFFFFLIRFYTYERVQEIVAFIQNIVPTKPEIAIICGSGLGGLAELIVNKIVIPYSDIPHFPKSTGKIFFKKQNQFDQFFILVVGHRSNLVFGILNGLYVVCMQGRFHPYEGYTTATVNRIAKKFSIFSLVFSAHFQYESCACLEPIH